MKRILLLALFVLSCDNTRLVQSFDKKCGNLCFSSSMKYRDVGVCRTGTWMCDEDGNILKCDGEILPTYDICDGLDNDCDGETDEVEFLTTCTGQCGLGYESCQNGQKICKTRAPAAEICNGVDDDCDGKIDEPEDMPVEFCYTADPSSLLSGECRPGVLRCNSRGYRECSGQVVPTVEVCDNLDNDCDGKVDNVDGGVRPVLIENMFCLDNSGSMSRYIAQVKAGVITFHQNHGPDPTLREGLVTAPDSDAIAWGSEVRLAQDLTDAGTFLSALNAQNGYTGVVSEPTIDALVKICKNDLGISWSNNARKSIILFTDEDPQSYELPGYTIYDAITECSRASIRIFCFVDSRTSVWGAPWIPLCTAPGNSMYDINGNIGKDLENVINNTLCL